MADPTRIDWSRSRKFFWWFLGIQLVPAAGILAMPKVHAVWAFLTTANTCGFFFNLARYHGQGLDPDHRKNRMMFLALSGLFALMAITYGVRLALNIYHSGSLSL